MKTKHGDVLDVGGPRPMVMPDAQVHSFSRMQSSSTFFWSGQPKFGHHVRIDGLWVKLHGVWEVS